MKTLHAFYSEKQANVCGTAVVYKTLDGVEILCSEVSDIKQSNWDDARYLGEVIHYNDGGFVQ